MTMSEETKHISRERFPRNLDYEYDIDYHFENEKPAPDDILLVWSHLTVRLPGSKGSWIRHCIGDL